MAALKGLKWSHVRGLLAVTDPVSRQELLDRCRRDGWTAREVLAKVQAQRRRRSKHALAARDVRSGLEGVALLSRRWIEESDVRLSACEVVMAKLSASVQTDGLTPLVDDAVESLDEVVAATRVMRKRLQATTKKLRASSNP